MNFDIHVVLRQRPFIWFYQISVTKNRRWP